MAGPDPRKLAAAARTSAADAAPQVSGVGRNAVATAAPRRRRLTLTQGQSGTVGGLRIQMLTAWSEPSSSNDAADVRVTPAG